MRRLSTAAGDDELLLEFGGAVLCGLHPLRAEKEADQLVVADLAGGAGDIDEFFDQRRKFFARDIVIGPAEVAVTMQNFGDGLFKGFAFVRDRFFVACQLEILRLTTCGADAEIVKRKVSAKPSSSTRSGQTQYNPRAAHLRYREIGPNPSKQFWIFSRGKSRRYHRKAG